MSADLTGIKPKNSYKSLMHVSDFSNGFTGSYQQVVDGDGTGCPLYININNVKLANELILSEQSAPGTPDVGTGSVYVKSNGLIYFKNDAGTEYDLTATSALADLDYGDVLVSGTGTVMTVQTFNGGSSFGTMASATAADYTTTAGLSAVALSNDYNDLTNLPNITEISQDATNSLLQSGTGISWSYNDGANTLTPTVTLAPFTTDDLAEGSNLYYTTARFNSAFTAKSTTDLVEGTRLYYTDERVDDRVSNLLVAGTNTALTYNDVANTLTIDCTTGSGITEVVEDTSPQLGGDLDLNGFSILGLDNVAYTGSYNDLSSLPNLGVYFLTADFASSFTTQLATKTTSDLTEGANLYFTSERVDDRVAALCVAGSNMTITYNDGAGTLTFASSGGGGAGLVDADYGDVVVSGSGTVMEVQSFNSGTAFGTLAGQSGTFSGTSSGTNTGDQTTSGTANEITVTNGATNPAISIPSAVTLTGKTLTGGTFSAPTIDVNDNVLSIRDNGDITKILQFECSGIANSTTRVLTAPDASGTIALTASTQPLDATLTSLAAFNTNGLLTQTAADTFTGRTLTGTASEITVTNGDGVAGNPTLSIPAVIDLGGKTSLEIPNSAAPTVDADGEIAVDTSVTDFSHGILKYFGGEEMAVVALPIAQLTAPTNNYAVVYDSTADEFQLKAVSGSGIANVVEDTTPQLGGDLDLNGFQITSPDGTDQINIPDGTVDLITNSVSRIDITDSGVRLGAANARVTTILDEDTMTSNSATALCTQQSIKAYVDANAGGGGLTIGKAYALSIGGFSN